MTTIILAALLLESVPQGSHKVTTQREVELIAAYNKMAEAGNTWARLEAKDQTSAQVDAAFYKAMEELKQYLRVEKQKDKKTKCR